MAIRLVVGCGYIGQPVAQAWRDAGDQVFAITRRSEFAKTLEQQGIQPIVWNWYESNQPETEANPEIPESIDSILISVSHAQQPGLAPECTHSAGLDNLIRRYSLKISEQTKWMYLSTTGVYGGQSTGEWLNEDSDVSPTRPGAIAAWAGEEWIRSHATASQRTILRPAGIYGPGRVPNWHSIRDGVSLAMDPDSYLNLIHQQDLVSVILQLTDKSNRYDLYCVADGNPPTRREYYQFIASLGNFPNPIFDSDGSGKRPRSDANKRVDATRLLGELKTGLQYPSYRAGLANVLHGLISVRS